MIGKPPGDVTKTYPCRGPLGQFRFAKIVSFKCFRCGREKKSKLITVYRENWNRRLCNGCYGRLLSIYEIKAGDKEESEKAAELSSLLVKLVSDREAQLAAERLSVREERHKYLAAKTLRFIGSAEYIAQKLDSDYDLDWSPVVIGLCKGFENELVLKLVRPWKEFCATVNLADDKKDRDIGRIAKYIDSGNSKDPELGTFGHFLRTALNSKSRRETSQLIGSFYNFLSLCPFSSWVLDESGLLNAIDTVTKRYRNKAAHIDELSKTEYSECSDFLLGKDGAMWRLCRLTS